MAFGKVRVLREFGSVEDYTLDKATTSVGRQPGNDIVLPTTAVSRYHAQFDVADGRVYVVDLDTVNGTFVNDLQIESNIRVPLDSGDQIVMGDVRLTYLAPEAREYFSLVPTVAPVETEGIPFRLLLDEPHQDVAPGARLNLEMLLENTGGSEDTYVIDVSGMDEEWVRINWRELTLAPGQQTEVQISVRPPRAASTVPGRYALRVRVALKEDPLQALEATRGIDIVGYSGLAMDIREVEPRGSYQVVVQNQGNIPLNIQFGGFSRSGSLDYRFSPGKVELEPGEVKRADLTVRPKGGRPLTGSQDIDFAVIARSLDPAAYQAPLPATYRMTASPATIAAGIGLPVLLGAGAVAFAVLLGLLLLLNILPNPLQTGVTATATRTLATQPVTEQVVPTDPPELATPVAVIDSFEVVPAQVTFRVVRDVILRWDVENIEEITLFSDDGEPLVLSDEDLAEGLVRVPSHILSPGDAVFRLRVVGTDGTPVIQEVTLTVQLQLCGLTDRAAIYELPLQTADRQQPVEGSVSIAGRSENMDWVYIRYGEEALNGWVEASNVNCPEGSQPLGDFVVIEAELPPGAEELPPDRGNTDR